MRYWTSLGIVWFIIKYTGIYGHPAIGKQLVRYGGARALKIVSIRIVPSLVYDNLTNIKFESADVLADLDNDGVVEADEIREMKKKLHCLLDTDDSGTFDQREIQLLMGGDGDAKHVFSKLDTNSDESISYQELDSRWEAMGAELTVDEVADWLMYAVQLPQYVPLFRKHAVSGYSFPLLIEQKGDRLKEIGVDVDLHRQQLTMAMKRKITGSGRIPSPIVDMSCDAKESNVPGILFFEFQWTRKVDLPTLYQLQRRRFEDGHWTTIYTSGETTYLDSVENAKEPVFYRVAAWNSFARSKRYHITCNAQAIVKHEGIWRYVAWLDEIALVLFLIFLPYRILIHGHANFLFRMLRMLPPNRPTSLTVERIPSQPSVMVNWVKPVDNGTEIIEYQVRYVCLRDDAMHVTSISEQPLENCARIDHLELSETYRFVVIAKNQFGKCSTSGECVYMLAMASPAKPARRRSIDILERSQSEHNKCRICLNPDEPKLSIFNILDKKILHYCIVCNRQFCHAHKSYVSHAKTLSCPAIGGRCQCKYCPKVKERKSEKKIKASKSS